MTTGRSPSSAACRIWCRARVSASGAASACTRLLIASCLRASAYASAASASSLPSSSPCLRTIFFLKLSSACVISRPPISGAFSIRFLTFLAPGVVIDSRRPPVILTASSKASKPSVTTSASGENEVVSSSSERGTAGSPSSNPDCVQFSFPLSFG